MAGLSSVEHLDHGIDLMNDLSCAFSHEFHTDTKLVLKGCIHFQLSNAPRQLLTENELDFIHIVEVPPNTFVSVR